MWDKVWGDKDVHSNGGACPHHTSAVDPFSPTHSTVRVVLCAVPPSPLTPWTEMFIWIPRYLIIEQRKQENQPWFDDALPLYHCENPSLFRVRATQQEGDHAANV